jgi:hypothetical protein
LYVVPVMTDNKYAKLMFYYTYKFKRKLCSTFFYSSNPPQSFECGRTLNVNALAFGGEPSQRGKKNTLKNSLKNFLTSH